MTLQRPENARIPVLTAVPEIVTQYAPMRAVLAVIERVASSDAPVLITGEPGTGKQLAARVLHGLSPRAAATLVEARCALGADGGFERELLGCERSLHAEERVERAGLLELAEHGTVFLKEVGALDAHVQGRLLHAMRRGVFHRVGGTRPITADVRVIASSSQDLAGRAADGAFRPELLTQLGAISIALPPLRDRMVDIRPLANHFLQGRSGRRPPVLSDEAVAALEGYEWPGNVRELRNVVERAALLARDGTIRAADLALGRPASVDAAPAGGGTLVSLEELERRHIETVLERVGWHQGRAAGILGISPKTLYRKMRGYGLRRPARLARRPETEHMA